MQRQHWRKCHAKVIQIDVRDVMQGVVTPICTVLRPATGVKIS